MTEPLRVTQRDIAERYGCSRATVSLALSGHPRISDTVRAEIARLAEQMGYVPDPNLTLLARSRFARQRAQYRATLAYLLHSGGIHYLQVRHLEAARERGARNGYQVEAFDLAEYRSAAAAAKVLYHRGIRGIIIPSMPPEVERMMQDPAWEPFTIVCCSLGWARFQFNLVTDDVFAAARLAWTQVLARGYRRIGAAMFRHDPVAEDDYARHGGSLAMQEALVPPEERIPILTQSGPKDRDSFLRWFETHRPEVVISFVSRACEWLTDAGYRVPEDVAFACLNVWSHERYTGIEIASAAMGEAAVDFLISQIHHHQRGVPRIRQTLMLEPHWLEGETLPPREAKKAPPPRPGRRSRG